MIEAQIAASRGANWEHHEALAATFAPDAVVLSSDDVAKGEVYVGENLHNRDGQLAAVTSLVADGTDRAVWFYAQLTVRGIEGNFTVRVSELLAADADWKVVSAAITLRHPYQPSHTDRTIPHATSAGPLTSAVLQAARSPLSISADYEEDEPDFSDLHASIGSIEPREIHGHGYGFVQLGAELQLGKYHSHALAQLFAVTSRDGWRVVLVHHIAD